MRIEPAICLVLLLGILALAACTTPSSTTTVTTTTTECDIPEEGNGDSPDAQECTTVSEETVVSRRPPECHGVLSCSFYVAGEAIALPFRALGTVFDVVF